MGDSEQERQSGRVRSAERQSGDGAEKSERDSERKMRDAVCAGLDENGRGARICTGSGKGTAVGQDGKQGRRTQNVAGQQAEQNSEKGRGSAKRCTFYTGFAIYRSRIIAYNNYRYIRYI